MELDVLTAISPIDGRYRGKTKALAAYFSEFALIKYRVQVEVEYFISHCTGLSHDSSFIRQPAEKEGKAPQR